MILVCSLSRKRVEVISNSSTLKFIKVLERFLGMVGFYSKYIPGIAEISTPLNVLRKKKATFEWGSEQEVAFKKLKEAITHPPVHRAQAQDWSSDS